jgi:hypothetical protein
MNKGRQEREDGLEDQMRSRSVFCRKPKLENDVKILVLPYRSRESRDLSNGAIKLASTTSLSKSPASSSMRPASKGGDH